jgi:predicted enzyme related to lactoylglutathione lyase
MEVTGISVQLATSNLDEMRAFYRDVVKLAPAPEMGDGSFQFGPAGSLFIVDHSEVSGPTKEPARAVLDIHITGIDAEHERLKAAGVKFIREKGTEYWGGVISTFNDPDGNTIQLMEFKPELAREEGAPATA